MKKNEKCQLSPIYSFLDTSYINSEFSEEISKIPSKKKKKIRNIEKHKKHKTSHFQKPSHLQKKTKD